MLNGYLSEMKSFSKSLVLRYKQVLLYQPFHFMQRDNILALEQSQT
jgi:hypothetical protein